MQEFDLADEMEVSEQELADLDDEMEIWMGFLQGRTEEVGGALALSAMWSLTAATKDEILPKVN